MNFVLIHSGIIDNRSVGFKKPFSRSEAFIWMLLEACKKKEGRDVSVEYGTGGMMIREEYGELCHSQRFMAKAWGWGHKKVRLFLRTLNGSEVALKTTHGITIVKIIKFNDYQNPLKEKGTRRAHGGHTEGTDYNSKTVEQLKEKKKSVSKKPKRKNSSWINSSISMNCDEFVAKMLESSQRHVQIIGHLADEMKPGLETKGQWQVFFDRYKKEASILVPFTDNQLAYGAREAIKNHPDIWTLETIKKEILKRKMGEK